MRTTSTELWDLIGGLTGSEKRYCRLAMDRGHLPPACTILWEVGQSEVPSQAEEQLCRLHPEVFPRRSALSKAKEYFLNFLLDALLDYNDRILPQREAYQILLRVQVLRTKGLQRHALRRLEKAEKLIRRYEIHELVEPLYRMWVLLLLDIGSPLELKQLKEKVAEQFPSDRRILDERLDYLAKWPEWIETVRTRADSIAQFPPPPEPVPTESGQPEIHSFHARSWLHTTRGIWFSLQGDREAALQERLALYELYQRHPQMIFPLLQQYTSNLYNIVSSLSLTARFEEAEEWFQKLESLDELQSRHPSKEQMVHFKWRARSARYVLAVERGDYAKAQEIYESVQLPDRPRPHTVLAEYVLVFHYNYIVLQYQRNRLDLALKHINDFLNLSWPDFRPEIYRACRIAEAAIRMELGHVPWLEYRLQNNLQELRRKRQTNGFEQPFFQALLQIIRLPESEQKSELASLKKKLPTFPAPPDPGFVEMWASR